MKTAWIIVSTQNTKKDTQKLLKEITSLKIKEIKVYVIENTAGRDGYARGVNKGLKDALLDGTTHFIVSNPDISIRSLNKSKLFDAANHFDIWGYVVVQNNQKYYGGVIDKWRLSGSLKSSKPPTRFIDVDFVSGSLIGFSKKVIQEIGYWDESYGMYYEDVDYCTRARRVGLKVGIDTNATYTHFEVSTTSLEKDKLLAISRIKYFWKYSNFLQKLRELVRIPKTFAEYRKLLVKEAQRRPFITNFLSLNTSSFINKLLNFFLFVVLVRSLSPVDYGLYNLAWTHVGLLGALADFGTTNYGILYLEKSNKVSFSQLFYFRFVLGIGVVVATYFLTYVFGFTNSARFLTVLILPVFVANAVSGSLLISLSRQNKSYMASIISVLFNLIYVSIAVAVLLITHAIWWVFVATCVLYVTYAIVNRRILDSYETISTFALPSRRSVTLIARNSYMFILLSFFAGLYFKADVYILNFYKGISTVGVYSAGYKFYEALMFIVGSYSIAAAAGLRSALSSSKNLFQNRIRRDSLFLFGISMSISIIGLFISPLVFPHILKGEFSSGLQVFQIVIFALPFLLTSNVYMNGLYLLKKTHLVVFVFVLQLICNVILNLFFVPTYSYIASSYITVIGEVLNLLLVLILFTKSYDNHA